MLKSSLSQARKVGKASLHRNGHGIIKRPRHFFTSAYKLEPPAPTSSSTHPSSSLPPLRTSTSLSASAPALRWSSKSTVGGGAFINHIKSSNSSRAILGRKRQLTPYAIAPWMIATLAFSTYYYQKHCNEEMVESIGPDNPGGEYQRIWSLFSLYRYLELTTDGPRFDLSPVAAAIDWQSIMKMAPTRSAMGLIYYAWSTLIHGIDNSTALFPSLDIKPKLIRMGVLDKLEEGLESDNSTVRLCAAYVINRLARNTQVARIMSTRPRIMKGLIDICNREILICESSNRFQGFVHSESNTSAEVFVTLLETVNNILDASVNKNMIMIGSSTLYHPVTDTKASSMLNEINLEFISRLAIILRQMELCDEHINMATGLFNDHHITLYQKFFPKSVDDQIRRRLREVEAEIARFLSVVSKDKEACQRLLLDREILKSITPLAITELRNASAYVHSVNAVHNILDRYLAVKPPLNHGEKEEDIDATSLLIDTHVNREALLQAADMVAERDDASVGRPFAKITSVYAMRCYTSSLACMVAGGIYGLIRTPASLFVHPIVAYSVNGVGAMLLNVLYGNYGVRNWVKNRTYIEDEQAHMAWTWSQTILDAGIITTIVRRHPYALVPMLIVNMVGHNTYPGTGLKRLDDGPEFAFRPF